ncbi:MAG: N-acetylmuramoyl-L-alanine amidase [Ignavibacteria bacterium]|nr:N-acetylmuramoyl-L-alanine amidase [Ignavibacteria bacterium]MBI3766000.1 N-acetylmuramoyl-L-alanine amidase [Ignavibacteriales bacterium]
MFRNVLFFLCFIVVTAGYSQNSLPVIFVLDHARNTQVATLTRNGIIYGSVSDLVRVFNLTTISHPEARKIELRSDQFSVKISPGNPFVIIVDQKENASLVQLPVGVIVVSTTYFVPIEAFIPILKTILSEEIAYDRTKIIVGRARPSSAFDVTGLSFEEKSNGFLIRIHCAKKIPDFESWPKQIGDNTWLYLTLANARADVNTIKKIAPAGMVRQILVFQSPTSVQLTFKLKGEVSNTEPIPAENGTDILLAIHTPTEEQLANRKAHNYERELQHERDKWKLDVVVIDAGHGGDDPGTIGMMKTKEKDITLAIALKLGSLIEKNLPKVRVVYTRKTDAFVELYRRGQIANQNSGKLFVSIHCNAMPRKPNSTDGFEIYLLRPGKNENALRIAERENSVVRFEEGYQKHYQELTEENFILLSMAQSAYVKYSEHFADILQQEMGKHLDITNNGVKQAGFYVLVGASMPNVLIETAYLSNKHDEKILRSPKGQQRIAESLFNAVRRYKLEYERSLQEGKDLGLDSR